MRLGGSGGMGILSGTGLASGQLGGFSGGTGCNSICAFIGAREQ